MSRISEKWLADVDALISRSENIVLTMHYNPDGDALGSALAMYDYLSQRVGEERVSVLSPNSISDSFEWMPQVDKIIFANKQEELAEKLIAEADLIFVLDYNDLLRSGGLEKYLRTSKATFVMIDHHPEPTDFAQHTLCSTAACSASELCYEFILAIGGRKAISKPLAECIFTGMMTDTGLFQHNSSQAVTYRIVADLLETGIDKDAIKARVFDNSSSDKMQLMGFALGQRMRIMPELRTGYIALSVSDLEQHNFKRGDTDGLVNYPLSIKGICVSVLLSEQQEYVKVSMRSKGKFDVNQIMRKHFEGGGHRNAAGGRSKLSLQATVAKLETVLANYKDQLPQCDK